MVNNINKTNRISQTSHNKPHILTSKKKTTKLEIKHSVIDEVITEIRQEEINVTKAIIQKKIIIKTLTHSLDQKAIQEPKFKDLYNYINDEMSKDKEAQLLIEHVFETNFNQHN